MSVPAGTSLQGSWIGYWQRNPLRLPPHGSHSTEEFDTEMEGHIWRASPADLKVFFGSNQYLPVGAAFRIFQNCSEMELNNCPPKSPQLFFASGKSRGLWKNAKHWFPVQCPRCDSTVSCSAQRRRAQKSRVATMMSMLVKLPMVETVLDVLKLNQRLTAPHSPHL